MVSKHMDTSTCQGVISWRSIKKSRFATSTMEPEFISCFEVTSQGIWIKSFIFRLRVMDSISKPLSLIVINHLVYSWLRILIVEFEVNTST